MVLTDQKKPSNYYIIDRYTLRNSLRIPKLFVRFFNMFFLCYPFLIIIIEECTEINQS